MSLSQQKLDDLRTQLALLEHSLKTVEDAALLDGIIDAEEQDAIDRVKASISKAKSKLLAAEKEALAEAAEEEEEDGGLLDFFGDAVDAVTETVSSTVNSVVDTLAGGAADAGAGSPGDWQIKGRLSGSVGKGGKNKPDDTATVQMLLNRFNHGNQNAPAGLVVDSDAGAKTNAAILKFQKAQFGEGDGRVDPAGASWDALTGGAAASEEQKEPDGMLSGVVDSIGSALEDAENAVADMFGGSDALATVRQLRDRLKRMKEDADKL